MREAILIVLMAMFLSACGGGGSGATAVIPPPDSPVVTAIHDIQGSGSVSPFDGQSVTVRGIVTGDFQNNDSDVQSNLSGFYLQEENADPDPVTSDGVFVYDGATPSVDVSVGDRVTVDGSVTEYFGETQITASNVDITAAGAGVIAETDVILPSTATTMNSDGELVADLEQFEGMLVRFPQSLTVTGLFNLERYGEAQLSQNGRLIHFTNDNAPSVAGYAAHLEESAARIIMLDDGQSRQNAGPIRYLSPSGFRSGDTTTDLIGNIRYSRGSGANGKETYRLMPTSDPSWVSANPRPAGTPNVGGALIVASFNLLNYFTTIDTGQDICGPSGDSNCRGANSQQEFERQRAKIITALLLLDADIVGLIELENNASDGLRSLVDGLNAIAGDGTYAFVDTGTIGSDAIRVGFLYKPASVSTAGAFAVLDSTVDAGFDDSRSRPTLAQSFTQASNGAILTVAVNHLKSKASSCSSSGDPDLSDGQANCNATRSSAAVAMADWLATDPTASGDSDVLIIGDLNANMQEDPVTTLEIAGYDNLLENFLGANSYSYMFAGRAGALDHALASQSLVGQVTGVVDWHINADEAPVLDYDLEFVEEAEETAAQSNLNLQMRLCRGKVHVYADRNMLRRVLVNLMQNAVDATPAGGRIVIGTRRLTGKVKLTVLDSGGGIAEDARGHLFQPFFSTKERGTGLGLYLIREIVMAHEGEVSLETVDGKGTRATTYLPLVRERARKVKPR